VKRLAVFVFVSLQLDPDAMSETAQLILGLSQMILSHPCYHEIVFVRQQETSPMSSMMKTKKNTHLEASLLFQEVKSVHMY
jgi:hypothetical protein